MASKRCKVNKIKNENKRLGNTRSRHVQANFVYWIFLFRLSFFLSLFLKDILNLFFYFFEWLYPSFVFIFPVAKSLVWLIPVCCSLTRTFFLFFCFILLSFTVSGSTKQTSGPKIFYQIDKTSWLFFPANYFLMSLVSSFLHFFLTLPVLTFRFALNWSAINIDRQTDTW